MKSRISLSKTTPFFSFARLFLFILGLSLLTTPAFGQLGGPPEQRELVGMPSPTAASLSKFAVHPVGLYTGTVQINVPLYTMEGSHLSIPISLNYHGAGIRVEELAGWVGLGWSLSAGGSVSRSMRGKDIDETGYSTIISELESYVDGTHPSPESFAINLADFLDSEPDIFSYSMPGKSGQFIFGDGTNIRPIPYSQERITYSSNEYLITTTDGTKYYFGTTSNERELTDTNSTSGLWAIENYVSSWHLARIESPHGDEEAVFEYYDPHTVTHLSTRGKVRTQTIGVAGSDCSYEVDNATPQTRDVTDVRRLKAITLNDIRVEFNATTLRQDAVNPDNGNQQEYLLNEIVIKRAGVIERKFVFNYDYFNPSGSNNDKRLKLESIQEQSPNGQTLPPYTFTYNESISLPSRDSYAIDHWGFYNGATSNSELLPFYENGDGVIQHLYDYASQDGTLLGSNRAASESHAQAGILEKITYPTGGSAEFEYELHKFTSIPTNFESDYSITEGGGLRIKKQTMKSVSNAPDVVYHYEYALEDAVVITKPRYYSAGSSIDQQYECSYWSLSSSSEVPLVSSQGSPVVYEKVKQFRGVNKDKGHTVYSYSFTGDVAGLLLLPETDVEIPDGPGTSREWKRGLLLNEQHYNSTGSLLGETQYNYLFAEDIPAESNPPEALRKSYKAAMVRVVDVVCRLVLGICYDEKILGGSSYEIVSDWYALDEVITTTYNDLGNDPVTYTTKYTYNIGSGSTVGHLQPTLVTETNSDGDIRNSEFKYAHEEYTSTSPTMESLNMLAPVYWTKITNGSGTLLQKNWTKWAYKNTGASTNYWLPSEEWIYEGGSDSDDPSTSNAVQSLVYDAYNSDGNLIRSKDARGIYSAYQWHSSGVVPTKIITNSSSTGQETAGSLTTQADYYPNTIRMKSLTDQNGVATYYKYDDFGRLTEILESEFAAEPIMKYSYTLQGSLLSMTNPNYILTEVNNLTKPDQKRYEYFDGLGRPIQTVTEEESDGTSIVTAMYYDELGREIAAWIPYRKSGFSFDSNPGTIGGSWGTAQSYHNDNNPYTFTKFKNDPLDRIDEVQLPDDNSLRATEYDYGTGFVGAHRYNWIRLEDPNNKQTTTYTDTFGNTKRISAPEGAITDFTYDTLGRLTKVTNVDYHNTDDQHIYYVYDGRSLLTGKSTPDADGDGDTTLDDETAAGTPDFEYRYDGNGNLRFVRDPNRRAISDRFLYYKYDEHNRLIEEGISNSSTGFDSEVDVNTASFPTSSITKKVTYTYVNGQLNIVTFYDKDGNSSTYDYDYDGRGRVDKISVNLHGLSSKTIEYDYDLQGQVTHTTFKSGANDEFHHWYDYDKVGRLSEVEVGTSSNQTLATRAARYNYYENGQVEQLVLGPENAAVQVVDYQYNLKGWLTDINNPENLGDDAFGLRLSYQDTPYWLVDAHDFDLASLFTPSYNGNITAALWSTSVSGQSGGARMGYLYAYDGLNRITSAENLQNSNPIDQFDWDNNTFFDVPTITYDKLGNIRSLDRKDETGSGSTNTYGYFGKSNRLKSLTDRSTDFAYDENGNIATGDINGKYTALYYDHRNLPETIISNGTTYTYRYDANGQRVFSSLDKTYYIRGIGGEVVAVYTDSDNNGTYELSYWNMLAGSEVIGRRTQ